MTLKELQQLASGDDNLLHILALISATAEDCLDTVAEEESLYAIRTKLSLKTASMIYMCAVVSKILDSDLEEDVRVILNEFR